MASFCGNNVDVYPRLDILHVETNLVLVCNICTNKRCNKVPSDAHEGKLTGTMSEGTIGNQAFCIQQCR